MATWLHVWAEQKLEAEGYSVLTSLVFTFTKFPFVCQVPHKGANIPSGLLCFFKERNKNGCALFSRS